MRRTLSVVVVFGLFLPAEAAAQNITHPEQFLHYVYPAGGRQGQTVEVELGGAGGLAGATSVVVDGPPGVSVRDVKPLGKGKAVTVRATFVIAADAPVGRR